MHRALAASLLLISCSTAHDVGDGNGGTIDAPTVNNKGDAPASLGSDAVSRPVGYMCSQTPPPDAPVPKPPPAPSSGAYTTLVAGSNTIKSSGDTRTFLLVLPTNLQPQEELPVLFMWYWLGGSANDFLEKGDVQNAANQQRFIAVIPTSLGDESVLGTSFDTKWPFDITQSADRMNKEFTFFDDMLSNVEHQFNVNTNCVSTAGVSAGALFTDQLASARNETLASFISLSGGVNDTIIKPWGGSTHHLPAIVLWGGDGPPAMDGNKDILGCLGIGMDFSVASRDMETALVDENHFIIECKHNCGHVEPPFDAPAGETKYAAVWDFAFNHPFWLPEGTSPYLTWGLPDSLPSWCAIGAGNAIGRSGSGCPPAENPCTY
jgi:hypothetical protein